MSTSTVNRIPAHGVGDRLPELSVHLDRTAIVAAAIASQDFEDVHHDPGLAQQRGMRDVFISINSTNGYIDRYVTEEGAYHPSEVGALVDRTPFLRAGAALLRGS